MSIAAVSIQAARIRRQRRHHAAAVIELIKSFDLLTVDCILALLRKRGVETYGDADWGDPESNVYLWTKVSDEFVAIMREVLADERVNILPVGPLRYRFGALPPKKLPVALQPTRARYVKPRWLPVALTFVADRELTYNESRSQQEAAK